MTTDNRTTDTTDHGFGPGWPFDAHPTTPRADYERVVWEYNPEPEPRVGGADADTRDAFTGWFDRAGLFTIGANDNQDQWIACSAAVDLEVWA